MNDVRFAVFMVKAIGERTVTVLNTEPDAFVGMVERMGMNCCTAEYPRLTGRHFRHRFNLEGLRRALGNWGPTFVALSTDEAQTISLRADNVDFILRIVGKLKKGQALNVVPMGVSEKQVDLDRPGRCLFQ